MEEGSRILVPVDGSDASDRAVEMGAYLAQQAGFALDLLFVSAFDAGTDAEDEHAWLPSWAAGSTKKKQERVLGRAQSHVPAGMTAVCHSRSGIPADEILKFAEAEQTGLIVIGGGGVSPVEGFLLGSVSQDVVNRSTTTVLVVK